MALASTAPICAASTQVHILVKRDLLCLPIAVIWPYHLYNKGMAMMQGVCRRWAPKSPHCMPRAQAGSSM